MIDAHHHLWDLSVRDPDWTHAEPVLHRTYLMDDLRPHLQLAGVSRTVLVQTVAVAAETPEFLAIAAASPEIAGVVGWVDLTSPAVAERLAELREGPGGDALVGIRHLVQSETDPRWLLRDDVQAGLRAVGEAGLVYDLLVTADQLPAAIETVRLLPEVRFVLDHGGKPRIATAELDPWRGDIAVLAAEPNVAVKLSGMLTEAAPEWTVDDLRPYADQLLDCFGATRTMIGSDWPVSLLRSSYAEVMATTRELITGASPAEQVEINGGTAVRWYGLRTGVPC